LAGDERSVEKRGVTVTSILRVTARYIALAAAWLLPAIMAETPSERKALQRVERRQ
jgi:hypothetical protein